jgi:primary-amine oxidase
MDTHRSRRQYPLTLIIWLLPVAGAAGATHPLDPLDSGEITAAVAALRAAGHADETTVFASVTLREPPKASVLRWKPGLPIPRAAAVVLRHKATTYEAVVDLSTRTVTSYTAVPGVQPTVTMPEILAAIELTTKDSRMQSGLQKRGLTDMSQVFCAPRTVGSFVRPEHAGRRLVKVDCFDIRGVRSDVFANPVEGLIALVDLDRREVLEVTDAGVVPVPRGDTELDPQSLGPQRTVRPVVQSMPEGSNITVDGWMVRWQKWAFHIGWESRAGTILSQVTFDDGRGPRSILYQGSIAEIYVPYHDPTAGWYYRTYMDQGDYGFGANTSPLVPGADCPSSAIFLSPAMATAAGGVQTLERRVCLFERSPGEPLWRHFDVMTEALESRPATELVLRYVATVGNYDYLLDWVLDQRGTITFRGGATGIDAVKGVAARTLADATAREDTEFGNLISAGRVGVNHDHFFSLRLDMDVDGPANSFMVARLVPERLPATSPRRSIWRVTHETIATDTDARFTIAYDRPAMWHVVNPDRTNALGYSVGYMLHASDNALPLVDADDPALGRAQFARHHLWVTPYDPAERYAAGTYPNQSAPGEGLASWTSRRRSIEKQDLVLWYTLGFHHVPSAEDWPVYNLGWHSVTLKPYNFFDRNPAVDVPPPVTAPTSASSDRKD